MASVHDVAAYILQKQGAMTAMKLQKLVYYAQAWSLARRGRPLFDEEVQAWAYGPVVYELYKQHRGEFIVARIPGFPELLGPDERASIDRVLESYGKLDGLELSKRTHSEEPWLEARGNLAGGQPSARIISKESMRRFYSHSFR